MNAMESEGQIDDMLWWARCKLGPRRFYWAIWSVHTDGVRADGYAATAEEAEAAALLVFRPLEGRYRYAHQGRAYNAARVHREKVAERRKREGGRSGAGRLREYLYTHHYPEEGPPYWNAHPILKRSARRVFVSRRRHCPVDKLGTDDEEWYLKVRDELEEAIVLDRQRLEREGHVYSRRAHEAFYLKPETGYERQSFAAPPAVIAALEVLGLRWPCSAAEVKAAYRRLSRQTHPDVGGSAEGFRRVNEAYERVASIV
jgi:hypothetical protein